MLMMIGFGHDHSKSDVKLKGDVRGRLVDIELYRSNKTWHSETQWATWWNVKFILDAELTQSVLKRRGFPIVAGKDGFLMGRYAIYIDIKSFFNIGLFKKENKESELLCMSVI